MAAGAIATEEVALVVEGRLSRDGIFGNGDDILLGERPVTVLPLAARATVEPAVQFSVPLGIDPGEYQVGLMLDPGALHYELSIANNRALSAGRSVVVPGWTLDVDALGEGDVVQDRFGILHAHGTQVALSARAGKGARFVGWSGDAVGGLSELTVLMDGHKAVQARFAPVESLQVRVVGGGAVTGSNDSGSYAPGELVTLTAVPAPGWEFAGWSGEAVGSSPSVQVTMDGPQAVMARFVLPVAAWRARHFSPAELLDALVSGDGADADGDGVTNGGEYRHGSDPRNALDRGAEVPRVEGGFLTMIYTRLQGLPDGYDLQVRGSRDAENWDEEVEERILSVEDGIETREARLPVAGQARGFLGFGH